MKPPIAYYNREHGRICKPCHNKRQLVHKKRYMENGGRERHAEYMQEYRQRPDVRAEKLARDRSDEVKLSRAARARTRYATDEAYRIQQLLRGRLWKALRDYGHGKQLRTDEYGIDWDAVIKRLGPRPGLGYEIDHVRPLASFDLRDPEQVRLAFDPANHQWLPAEENRAKADSV